MEENISDLRKMVFALREKVSKEVSNKISMLANNYGYNEKWYYEDVMRRAAGNTLPDPTDITIHSVNAYKRFLVILEGCFIDDESIKNFEENFIKKILDYDEEALPNTLNRILWDRLSNETEEKRLRLAEDYGRLWYIKTQAQLIKVIKLKPLTFQKYEKDIIIPDIDEELAKAIEDELMGAGLIQKGTGKKPDAKKKYSKLKSNVVSMADRYFEAIDKLKISTPTAQELEDVTGLTKSTWNRYLSDPISLAELRKKAQKMQSYIFSKSDESKDKWKAIENIIDEKIDKVAYSKDAMSKKKVEYNDNKRQRNNSDVYADLDDVIIEEQSRRG